MTMMSKLRRWFAQRLDILAREGLLHELDRLERENQQLRDKCDMQASYINGLQAGIRAQRRIVIQTGGAPNGGSSN